MSPRPYKQSKTAVQLREIYARGLSWRQIGKALGYHYTTAYNCAVGRDHAGPALARDVAALHARREAA